MIRAWATGFILPHDPAGPPGAGRVIDLLADRQAGQKCVLPVRESLLTRAAFTHGPSVVPPLPNAEGTLAFGQKPPTKFYGENATCHSEIIGLKVGLKIFLKSRTKGWSGSSDTSVTLENSIF